MILLTKEQVLAYSMATIIFFLVHITPHSRPMRNQMKLKETLMGPVQGEWVCLKDFKYILFEILALRRWKGCALSLIHI